MGRYLLKLYITGRTSQSERAIANLRPIRRQLDPDCAITVIDVVQQPQLAEAKHYDSEPHSG